MSKGKKPAHARGNFLLPNGTNDSKAVYPVILSASRATDIPAYYSDWFMGRLKDGFCQWVNPFNAKQRQTVAFKRARAVVFWSKNPEPLLHHLDEINDTGLGYYIHFTLNDYTNEGLEPNIPSLSLRIKTFEAFSKRLGPDRIIWRYDPLLLSDSLSLTIQLDRILSMAKRLKGMTKKLVISFADIAAYRAVRSNLGRKWWEFTRDQMIELASGLSEIQMEGLKIATCAEKTDLTIYGINQNKCIDDELLAMLYPTDLELLKFLGHSNKQGSLFNHPSPAPMKDPGQREECKCVLSKDIGAYNTCPNLCLYCYANNQRQTVVRKFETHKSASPVLGGSIDI